jgi:hypothetical protein
MPATDAIATAFLPEFDRDLAGVRRALERAPEDRYDGQPHARSWTLRQLVSHLAELPAWCTMAIQTSELDLAPVNGPKPESAKPVVSPDECCSASTPK